jgi:iron complex outermembrane receptor protein
VLAGALLASVAAAPSLRAQSLGIRGRVTNSVTHAPVADVRVVARTDSGREAASTRTGADGRFSLRGLARQRYAVSAARAGFAALRRSGVRPDTAGGAELSLELTPLPMQLGTIVVSATRSRDTLIDVPADVQRVTSATIEEFPTLTPSAQLRWTAGVDYAASGLMQANFVTRGFNNIFASAMLVLSDSRAAFLPSLHFESPWVVPTPVEDVERVEVLLGPASAIYGPNSGQGVMQVITKSPFDWPGTTMSVSGGGHSGNDLGGAQGLWRAAIRQAGTVGEKFGYKLTAQYMAGRDWSATDPMEIAGRDAAIAAGADPDTLRIGDRDAADRRWTAEARADYRTSVTGILTANVGRTDVGSLIELTPLGAAQVKGWQSDYYQVRYQDRRFFAQAFLNTSDAGNTFLLRTGNPIVDQSRMFAAQVQHGVAWGNRETLSYGVDAQRTEPRTGGTIDGRNENDDTMDELGAFLLSNTRLSPTFDFRAAGRVDRNSRIAGATFSPRAALTWHPSADQSWRLTWNHAFDSPSTTNLFLDLVEGQLSPLPFNVRALGVPSAGLPFRRDAGGGVGGLYMRSPFVAGDPKQALPADATLMWPAVVQIMQANGVNLAGIPAPTASQVGTVLRVLDPSTGAFNTVLPSDVHDLAGLKNEGTNTIELGYKGPLGRRVQLTTDLYWERRTNFVSPLTIETPNVFFDATSLATYLEPYMPGGTTQERAAAAQAIAAAIGGIPGTTGATTGIPVGTVSPEGALAGSPDVLLTYRNFGKLDRWGADVGMQAVLSDQFTLTGTYSWTSRDLFPRSEVGGLADIALNAPRNKASLGVRYGSSGSGFTAELRGRHVAGFPMQSGSYMGQVDGYTVADLGAAYRFQSRRMIMSLSAQNVLDHLHREFLGAPLMGRLVIVQTQVTF